jgi:hypothetical protein
MIENRDFGRSSWRAIASVCDFIPQVLSGFTPYNRIIDEIDAKITIPIFP